jgi:predicted nucleic acid-binding protein
MSDICVDTGFLIGLYDLSDQYHERAKTYFAQYFETSNNRLLVPFPILYEAVSTWFVRDRRVITLLERDWKHLLLQRRLVLMTDLPFRDDVIDECFAELGKPLAQYRALSAVDRVIRRILSDVNIRVSAFVTFNPGDFADVCGRFNRELVC